MLHKRRSLRDGRRSAALFSAVLGFALLCFSSSAFAGYAAIVVDEKTGEVLSDVNADQVNHPASLTKMMTLYLAFEALHKGRLNWAQPLYVSSWASEKSPTKLGLEPGSFIPVRDCVLGMIVLSANDAATVMSEALGGGSEDAFAGLMTAKAHELGMEGSNFVNASGLPDEDQVSTARDLAKLAVALYRNFPQEYRLFSTREFYFRGRLILGHNRLMYRYPGMDGLKTGYTTSSGFNLASSAERDGRRLFGVVLGSESASARDLLMARLLDDGFAGRTTDPTLVAEAAGLSTRVARHLLIGAERVAAALSPVSRAEAAPLARSSGLAKGRGGVLEAALLKPRWSIQVGAFARAAQAEAAARKAAETGRLAGHAAQVAAPPRGERVYRARLGEFTSEKQARDACQVLRKKGTACSVVAPAKPGLRLASNRG